MLCVSISQLTLTKLQRGACISFYLWESSIYGVAEMHDCLWVANVKSLSMLLEGHQVEDVRVVCTRKCPCKRPCVCVGDNISVQMPQIPAELGWFLRASKQPWDPACMCISICYLGVHMLSSKCVASQRGSGVRGDKSHEEVIRDSALLPKKARVGETTGESARLW